MKFIKMVTTLHDAPGERALWTDEATGDHVVTVYYPYGPPGLSLRIRTCVAYAADESGAITDFQQLAVVNTPESASKVANLREPIYLSAVQALWHVAAIRQIEARKAE